MVKKSNNNETKEEAQKMNTIPAYENRTTTANGRQGSTGVTK